MFFVPVGARGVFSLINETFSHFIIFSLSRLLTLPTVLLQDLADSCVGAGETERERDRQRQREVLLKSRSRLSWPPPHTTLFFLRRKVRQLRSRAVAGVVVGRLCLLGAFPGLPCPDPAGGGLQSHTR